MINKIVKYFCQNENKYLKTLFENLREKNEIFLKELGEDKKKDIEETANIFSQLKWKEKEYLTILLNKHLDLVNNSNFSFPEIKEHYNYKIDNDNYYNKINLLNGIDNNLSSNAGEENKEKDKKEVVKEEKANFNIELTSFEPKSKMTIIKEIKAKLGLGLKDSKELVDKVPSIILKKVSKIEAEEFQSKFEQLGCKITLI